MANDRHLLAAMPEVRWNLDTVGHVDPAPAGARYDAVTAGEGEPAR